MFVEKLVATQSVGYTAMLESRSYYSWLVGNRLLQATAIQSFHIKNFCENQIYLAQTFGLKIMLYDRRRLT